MKIPLAPFPRRIPTDHVRASPAECNVRIPTSLCSRRINHLSLHGQRFETIRQAKDETIARLLWYNQTRMHPTLGYASPVEFETEWENALAKAAA